MSIGSEPARPARAPKAWPLAPMLVVLLCGCAADAPMRDADTDADTDTASGPTIYGQFGVSVDRVSTR